MPNIMLRPLNLEIDADQYVGLVNLIIPDPVPVERVREWKRNFPPDGIRQQMVALDENQCIVGCNETTHRPNMLPHTFFVEAIVLPNFRRCGIGTLLYDNAVDFARAHSANRLVCEVHEGQPEYLQFVQARGFRIDRHIFESTLDLTTFDESRFAGVIESVQAQGIRFFTLADVGNIEENQRKLYDVNKSCALDIPGWEGEYQRFEDFRKNVFQSSWFRAEGQILAADGERWIGLGAVGYFAKTNSTYNMHTGVLREYRGRKIALALKLLTIRRSREWGALYARTNNDSENAPILAINRKLGYKPQPGFFKCVKDVE